MMVLYTYFTYTLLYCTDVVSSPRRIAAAMQQPLGILNKTNKWFCKAIKHDFGDSLFWPYRYYVMSWCIINYTLIIHFYGSYIDNTCRYRCSFYNLSGFLSIHCGKAFSASQKAQEQHQNCL